MRLAAEASVWRSLKKARKGSPGPKFNFGGAEIDLSDPCVVLGGLNGTGKTRLLRALAAKVGSGALMINLHTICEQSLGVLRSRDDFSDMKDEFGVFGPEQERRSDVERIIGREYDSIEWYALEIGPTDHSATELFELFGDQPLAPYFDVQYRGVEYSSIDMGLGEFSIHLLFWIIEQYRDVPDVTLILDEPDAYLPPVGGSALLFRLLKVCLDRGWRLVVATHSSAIIADAISEDAFVLLQVDEAGGTVATHCREDSSIADALLATPPVRQVLFVEDESACILARVLVETLGQRVSKATSIVWGNGSGYMSELQRQFPQPPDPEIRYAYVYDGDKRSEVRGSGSGRWPAIFLPTSLDPDDLFKSLRADISGLAERMHIPKGELGRRLDVLEGMDPHDWVNKLGEEYGRQKVLRTLAELWVEANPQDASNFIKDLQDAVDTI